jgi:ferredoxin
MFQGTEGFNRLRIIILVEKKRKKLSKDIERTIKRLQSCIFCEGCTGICPQNAIYVDSHFSIKETLCTHCGKCLSSKYLPFGCVTVSMKRQWRT